MYEILAILFCAALTGFVAAHIGKGLDSAMDYGHILDWLRLRVVRRAAKRTGQEELFNSEFEKRIKIEDFSDRVNAVDKLYWGIAIKHKPLTLWLCNMCIGHRVNLALSAVIIAAYCVFLGFYWPLIPFFFISYATTEYFLK